MTGYADPAAFMALLGAAIGSGLVVGVLLALLSWLLPGLRTDD